MNVKDAVDLYLAWARQVQNLSPNTVDAYKRDLSSFAQRLTDTEVSSVREVRKEHIDAHIERLGIDNQLSSSSQARHLVSIRQMFSFLAAERVMEENPAADAYLIRRPGRSAPLELDQGEIDQILLAPDPTTPRGSRDRAMFRILYDTGIQVSSLVCLTADAIDGNTLRAKVRSRFQTMSISDRTVEEVNEYLKIGRHTFVRDVETPYLFLRIGGRILTRQGFWKLLKTYAAQAGFKADISPRSFPLAVNIYE